MLRTQRVYQYSTVVQIATAAFDLGPWVAGAGWLVAGLGMGKHDFVAQDIGQQAMHVACHALQAATDMDRRARRDGITGTKALILYPMNALANDQAQRLTQFITTDERAGGITAAA